MCCVLCVASSLKLNFSIPSSWPVFVTSATLSNWAHLLIYISGAVENVSHSGCQAIAHNVDGCHTSNVTFPLHSHAVSELDNKLAIQGPERWPPASDLTSALHFPDKWFGWKQWRTLDDSCQTLIWRRNLEAIDSFFWKGFEKSMQRQDLFWFNH